MCAVDPDLPVISDTVYHGCLKTQPDHGINKEIDKIIVVGLIHAFSHIQDAVQCCGRKFILPRFYNGKSFLYDFFDIQMAFMTDKPA